MNEQTESYVNFEIKNYDYVGPAYFHEDDELDPYRDAYSHPWLSIKITVLEPGRKRRKDEMEFSLVYKLDERHLSINKSKRSFRPNKPDKLFVKQGKDGNALRECEDMTLMFRVAEEFVIYSLED